MKDILTLDNLLHFATGLILSFALCMAVGPDLKPQAVVAALCGFVFWVRENAQAVAKKDPDAWPFWRWSRHRLWEMLTGAIGAGLGLPAAYLARALIA